MNLEDIQTLYAYNRWASERLFAALEKLNEYQFTVPVQSSFPSIRETLFHILFAEWLWLKRWQGRSPRSTLADPDGSSATWSTLSPGGVPTVKEPSTLEGLKSFADSIEQERLQFLGGLNEDALQATLQYTDMVGKPFALPLAQQMQHVVNHGTYHRGQVTTMLRQVGAEAASLDMSFFFRERAKAGA
ncbi:MAG TPA: DinB family protein [Terriglobales bacterium]|nr:DinB family protein [Terriglobales bacterium]